MNNALRESAVHGFLEGGPKTLREAQDALASDRAFGNALAVISTVQAMARRGVITRTPGVKREKSRMVAVYALPGPTEEEALHDETLAFVRDIATNYDHEEDAHKRRGTCFVCDAEKLLAKLEGRAA